MKKTSYIKSTFMAIIVTLFLISFVGELSTSGAIETSNPAIYVTDTSGRPGDEVTVNIEMKNSPGVAGIIINVIFDNDKLTLEQIEYGAEFETGCDLPQTYTSPVILSWGDLSEKDGNLTFAKLTFKINKDISTDSITNIRVEYKDSNIIDINEESVQFDIHNGEIVINTGLPGDINGDGEVNAKDLLRLRKYFAGWNVVVDGIAVDVNGDGDANAKDLLRLRKYFAGWEVEIFYGAKSNSKCAHLMERIPAVQTGCTESGNFEYWHCEKCGKYFSDANGNTEITLESTVIPATGHTYSDEWSYDEQYHWHEMNCGHEDLEDVDSVIDFSEHSFDSITHCCTCGQIEHFNISFVDYNGRSLKTISRGYGERVVISDEVYEIERAGYLFVGWSDNGQIIEALNVTESTVLVAEYKKAYTVVFVFDNSIFNIQTVAEGGNATKPVDDPKKEGYVFSGWEDFNNITANRVVNASFTPIQYEVMFMMPDGSAIGTPQNVSFGANVATPQIDEYWFNWDNYHMYSFTGWTFNGSNTWDYSNVEADVISQYEVDNSRKPIITFIANYSTEYNLPVVVIEGEQTSNAGINADMSIVLPSNMGCYLYAIDLRFSYNAGNLAITGNTINESTIIYDETNTSSYNNKTKDFRFVWTTNNYGVVYDEQQIIDSISFSRPNGQVLINADNFVLLDDSSIVIASSKDADYIELQNVTPIVVYINK